MKTQRGTSLPERRDQRLLVLATFVNSTGLGLVLAATGIYLVRSAGLTAGQVGLGLTLGGLAGIAGGFVLGDLADFRGAREVAIATLAVEAIATLGLIFVKDMWSLALVSAIAAVGRAGGGSAAGAMIGLLAQDGDAARFRALIRAVTNAGIAVGMVAAAIVLALDDRTAYVAMFVLDAATFLAAGVVIARIPHLPPSRAATDDAEVPDAGASRWAALRDTRYLGFTVASSVASLQYFVLTTALPLWIVLHTDAPRWLNAALLFVAAALVAAIQVPATRWIADRPSAGRAILASAPLFLVAWVAMAATGSASAGVAAGVLLVAVVVHSLGEVWQAGGTFELSFSLAHPDATGQYLGTFGLGTGLADALAPAIVVALCVEWGAPGWIALAAIVSVASVVCWWLAAPPGREPGVASSSASAVSG
jgi:MFS family permease